METSTSVIGMVGVALGITFPLWMAGTLFPDTIGPDGKPVSHPAANLLRFLGGIGPITSAIVFQYFESGFGGVKDLLFSTYRLPVGLTVQALLFGAILLPTLATALTMLIPSFRPINGQFSLQFLIVGFIFSMIIIPMEEIGWRGFLLPRLYHLVVDHLSGTPGCIPSTPLNAAILTSCIMGVIWALWHLPLYFLSPPHLFRPGTPNRAIKILIGDFSYAIALAAVSLLQGVLLGYGGEFLSSSAAATSSFGILPAVVTHSALNGVVGFVIGPGADAQFGMWWFGYGPILAALVLGCVWQSWL
ncbi:hypothetical protein Pelo_10205 [Pelomyxa schiedti]|nr:hypothetical protein Pelo_10205 [Pelomyxa schiedti]